MERRYSVFRRTRGEFLEARFDQCLTGEVERVLRNIEWRRLVRCLEGPWNWREYNVPEEETEECTDNPPLAVKTRNRDMHKRSVRLMCCDIPFIVLIFVKLQGKRFDIDFFTSSAYPDALSGSFLGL